MLTSKLTLGCLGCLGLDVHLTCRRRFHSFWWRAWCTAHCGNGLAGFYTHALAATWSSFKSHIARSYLKLEPALTTAPMSVKKRLLREKNLSFWPKMFLQKKISKPTLFSSIILPKWLGKLSNFSTVWCTQTFVYSRPSKNWTIKHGFVLL